MPNINTKPHSWRFGLFLARRGWMPSQDTWNEFGEDFSHCAKVTGEMVKKNRILWNFKAEKKSEKSRQKKHKKYSYR